MGFLTKHLNAFLSRLAEADQPVRPPVVRTERIETEGPEFETYEVERRIKVKTGVFRTERIRIEEIPKGQACSC